MNTISKQVIHNGLTATIKALAVGPLLLLAAGTLSLPTLAQEHSDSVAVQQMSIPQTIQGHKDRAEAYSKKAAGYHQEAQVHRMMLVEYSKGVARTPKELTENAYIKKMRLHCERYIKSAENLAREAEEMAKFHQMRAKEIEEK